ncbi:MAG: DNA polymerase III subunit delta', partial [Betaproteobacteria bacterium]|nr:DNA polymerase III subunit delta' [Betaproteobacteria bacterium]
GAACGRCAACGWLERGNHPDFRRLEPESFVEQGEAEQGGEKKPSQQIQVEQVRDIGDFVVVSSHRGGVKVVLIHPAEALNANAANALLKNLEEPPPRTQFILVAHRWHRLLPTIRSRCQHVALAPPDTAVALAWLKTQDTRNPGLALAQAGGAPLLALRFDDEYWRLRAAFLDAITGRGFDPLHAAETLRECPPALVTAWLQKWSFDLVSHQVTGRARYNPDRAEAVAADAARLDRLKALRYHRQMVELQRVVTHPLNSRLFLEQLLLSYASLLRGADLVQAA